MEVKPWHYAVAGLILAFLVVGIVVRSQRTEVPRTAVGAGATPHSGPYEDAAGPPKAPAGR